MSTILRNLLASLTIAGMASSARAAILFSETFSYPDGRLASAPPTGGVSGGLWIPSHPSGFMAVNVSSGKVILFDFTQPSQTAPLPESVKREFSAPAAGQTLYAGFDVSASGNNASSFTSYFAAFSAGTKLFVTPFTGSDYTLGIGNEYSFTVPTVSWPSGLTFGNTHRVVMSYEFDTGTSKLWVDPVNQSSNYISLTEIPTNSPSAFWLRQYKTPEGTPSATQVLDNLVVGTTFDDVLAVPAPALLGDYNSDGAVNAADYVVWRNGLGTIYTQTDYSVWRAQFGQAAGSGTALPSAVPQSAAVPEPASVGLAGFGLGAVGVLTLRQRRVAAKLGRQFSDRE